MIYRKPTSSYHLPSTSPILSDFPTFLDKVHVFLTFVKVVLPGGPEVFTDFFWTVSKLLSAIPVVQLS